MNIAFFGSSLLSAYWNGAATYYRGIIRALHERGHRITFYEPDAFDRQSHRDIDPPPWAKVVVYANSKEAAMRQVEAARGADLVVKASGVGVFDELLEEAVLALQSARTLVIFWDVDAPATLDRMHTTPRDPFRLLVPRYDLVFTYGGGPPVMDAYKLLGARDCIPIYNALDPDTHFPVNSDARFAADVGFLANRLPDREKRVEEFFLRAAEELPARRLLLGGNGWFGKGLPENVTDLGHVYTADHNAFNCTPSFILNVSRESMARYGFSPATRVFEAAGAAACVISDQWEGIETFFEPETEMLVARSGSEVADLVRRTSVEAARQIGKAAYRRALTDHTYSQRAAEVEAILDAKPAAL